MQKNLFQLLLSAAIISMDIMMKGQPLHPAIARVQIKKIFLVKDGRALFLDKVSCNECPMMIIGWPVGEKKAKGTDAKVSQMFRLQKYQLL